MFKDTVSKLWLAAMVVSLIILAVLVFFVVKGDGDESVTMPKGDLLSVTQISGGMEVRVIRLADDSEVACMVTTNGNGRPNSVDCDWK